jgi:hypothetical protein
VHRRGLKLNIYTAYWMRGHLLPFAAGVPDARSARLLEQHLTGICRENMDAFAASRVPIPCCMIGTSQQRDQSRLASVREGPLLAVGEIWSESAAGVCVREGSHPNRSH